MLIDRATLRVTPSRTIIATTRRTAAGWRSVSARLTPLQAQTATAEAERFVLCVVDLRGVPAERLDAEWAAGDVEPLAKLVTDIGGRVKETWVLVGRAKSQEVAIRNETALRYVVPAEVWGVGQSVAKWVESIVGTA